MTDASALVWVVLKFRDVLQVPDPFDGEPILSNRAWLRTDRLTFDDGTLNVHEAGRQVGSWPLDVIVDVGFSLASPRAPKAYTLAQRRAEHRQAYARWTPDEEAQLLEAARSGASMTALADTFGRKPSAIATRLARLRESAPPDDQGPAAP